MPHGKAKTPHGIDFSLCVPSLLCELQAAGQYAERHVAVWESQAIANMLYGLGLLRYSHGSFMHAVAEHVSG